MNKIYFAEDTKTTRLVMLRTLLNAGFEVKDFENGKMLYDELKEVIPDLIITDVNMPVMNGFKLVEKIRKNSQFDHIPIILITDYYVDLYSKIKGFVSGANDYLIHPINEATLIGKVKSMIRTKKLFEKNQQLLSNFEITNKILRHDLMNDLAVMKSGFNMYFKDSDDKILKQIATRLDKCIGTIRKQREDRINKQGFDLEKFELSQVLENVLKNYPELEINLNGSGNVMADSAIYSVFDNMISNAITHGKTKRVDIRIENLNNINRIVLSDFGKGISDDIREKIFEKGFKSGKTGHTGIGLFIVKKTILAYNGNIKVEDNNPNGTKFIITLPKAD